MALDTASVKFVCAAKSLGVDFNKTLMIGRQRLFPEKSTVQRIFSVHGIDGDAAKFLKDNEYGEELFALLGAQDIQSLDYSSYEKATRVHDMNSPIPEELRERFSVVYDGGTLEHVFNAPQALKNCMEMVEVGGHFLQVGVANNFMGHGFWQFSPELIFRVFSPENGFETEVVLLHEVVPGGSWYAVSDPDCVHRRVQLCNSSPTYILTIAKRVSKTEIFAQPPLQSDYSALWDRCSEKNRESSLAKPFIGKGPQRSRLRSQLPEPVKRVWRAIRQEFGPDRGSRSFDQSCYRVIVEDDLLRGLFAPDRDGSTQ